MPLLMNNRKSKKLLTSTVKAKNYRQFRHGSAPVVGILSTVKLSSTTGFPLGKEARIFQEKFAIAKQYGIIMFLFYADDIDWINKTINGYQFITDVGMKEHWERTIFPFPDVVYNRIRYRNVEKQPNVRQLLKFFDRDSHIKLFNTRFLDKWEVHEALVSDPTTSKMVPPTMLFSDVNLKHLLNEYSEVFIKPRNNNAGREIIKIVRNNSDIFSYCQSASSPPSWIQCSSFSNLCNHLSILIQNPNNYIVQTGIDLCRLEKQVFDLRAQVQKNGQGQWVFTGMNVRVATGNRFVTYPKAVKRAPFDKVVAIVTGGSEVFRNKIYSQLSNLYYNVPRVLDENLGLSLAILSIDIGMDIHGKPWIIEVSSKSDSFDEKDIRARHFQYLMEYFLYITTKTRFQK